MLQKLITHYAKADKSVTALGKELLELLAAAKDDKKRAALKPPAEDDAKKAEAAIKARETQPSPIKDQLNPALFKPETLAPDSVQCP